MSIVDMLPYALPSLGILGAGFNGTKLVQEGERGIKLRFGRAIRTKDGRPKIINPGFVFVLPMVESLERTHVRTRTINLDTQSVMLKDKMVFNVNAVIMMRIIDSPEHIYQSLFEVDSFEETISDYVTAVVREVLSHMSYTEVLDPQDLGSRVKNSITEKLNDWGVDVLEVMITDSSPTQESAKAILLTAEAELRTQALIDVADDLSRKDVSDINPTLAAAIIGTPISVSLTNVNENNQ